MNCPHCGSERSIYEIDGYKSTWFWCDVCNNARRVGKSRFWLQFLDNPLVRSLPMGKRVAQIFGHRPKGANSYKYYTRGIEEFQKNGARQKWGRNAIYEPVVRQLARAGFELHGCRLLDISGEPGFFALDAAKDGALPTVTAFAPEVAESIKLTLGINAVAYDFNIDDIATVLGARSQFDVVTIRYAIGFCEDLPEFMKRVARCIVPGGALYISFSPSSKAVCTRWMVDDYTYLRQYTESFVREVAHEAGFRLVGRHDDGAYHWASGYNKIGVFVMYAYRIFYRRQYYSSEYHKLQHNIAFVFTRSAPNEAEISSLSPEPTISATQRD